VDGQTAKVKVVVRKAGITIKLNKKKCSTKKYVKLKAGENYKLKASSNPTGKIRYKIGNKKLVQISGKGFVRALRPGETYIKITCNGNRKKLKVKVD
jgi:hypothetical protein